MVDPDITYAEDAVFLYKYLLKCHSIVIYHKCFYHYRYREDSIVHAPNRHILMEINKAYLSLEKEFRNHPMEECLLYQLQKWVSFASCKAVSEHMGFDSRIRILAVNNKALAERIKGELKKKGIPGDRLTWRKPLRIY